MSDRLDWRNGRDGAPWRGLALVWLLASACGRAPAEEPAAIRIGLLLDSGTYAARPTLRAAELAVAAVGEDGGLEAGGRRHRVELVVEDTGNTPEGGARATLELINQHQVVALIGSNTSLNAIPEAEIAGAAGVPIITPSATHPETTAGKRCSFRVAFTDPQQSRALARVAAEDLGTPPAAILYDAADAYSRDLAAEFRRAYEAEGGRLVAEESYTTGDRDFRPQLERIRQSRAGALFLPNFRGDVEPQIRQARQSGIDATFLGADAWLVPSLAGIPEAEGSYAVTHWQADGGADRAEARRFVERYRAAYGEDPLPPAANAFDAAGLLLRAIRDGGSAEPASICEQLSLLDGYRGVTGTLGFRGRDGDPRKPVLIVAIRDGRVVLHRLVES